jgi:uncharacterized membrane protein
MDPTHLHLLLNHFPTVGFMVALVFFVGGLISKSEDLKRASLVVFVGIALLTVPAYVTGNAAQDRLSGRTDVSQTLVEAHEGLAFLTLVIIELTGAIAWLGLWQFRRSLRLPAGTAATLLVLGAITMALAGWTANIGGEISHAELRGAVERTTFVGPLARTVGDFVRDTPWAWISSETLHFIGLTLLLGVVLLLDLRVLGVARRLPVRPLEALLPWAMLGFAINTLTGMLFFAAAPGQYSGNVAFYWKLGFVLLAGANATYLTFDRTWTLQPDEEAPMFSKVMATGAVVLCVGILYWGNMLAFIGNAF